MNLHPLMIDHSRTVAMQRILAAYLQSLRSKFDLMSATLGEESERTYFANYLALAGFIDNAQLPVPADLRQRLTDLALQKIQAVYPETHQHDPDFKLAFQNAVCMLPDSMEWLRSHPVTTQTELRPLATGHGVLPAGIPTNIVRHSVSAMNILARTAKSGRLAAADVIKNAIREEKVAYAVVEGATLREIDYTHRYDHDRFDNLFLAHRGFHALKRETDSVLVFKTKEEAYLYARKTGKHNCAILTLMDLRDSPEFDTVVDGELIYRSQRISPDFTLAMGMDWGMNRGRRKILQFATQFDPIKPISTPIPIPGWKKAYTRLTAHREYMKAFANKPLTVTDLRAWLRDFYCNHYLSPESDSFGNKQHELLDMLNNVDRAEKAGVILPTDLEVFLKLRPSGQLSFNELINRHRSMSYGLTWGMQIMNQTFFHQKKRATPTRFNRNRLHDQFMKTLSTTPTVSDLLQWIRKFYCNDYLVHQYNGAHKQQHILSAVDPINPQDLAADLTIEEFFKQYPSLTIHLKSTRKGERRDSWGWKKIEEDFIEPSRLKTHAAPS